MKLIDKPFNDPDWVFELKWDGYRALAYIIKGRAELISRNAKVFTGYGKINKELSNHYLILVFKIKTINVEKLCCRVLEEPCILSCSFSLNGDKSVTVFATRSFKTSCLSTLGPKLISNWIYRI